MPVRRQPATVLRPLARDDDPVPGHGLVTGVRRDRLELLKCLGLVVFAGLLEGALEAEALVRPGVDELADPEAVRGGSSVIHRG